MGQARTTVANGELKDHDLQPVLLRTLLSAKTLKEDRRAKLLGGLHLGGRKHGVFATHPHRPRGGLVSDHDFGAQAAGRERCRAEPRPAVSCRDPLSSAALDAVARCRRCSRTLLDCGCGRWWPVWLSAYNIPRLNARQSRSFADGPVGGGVRPGPRAA